MSLVDNILQKVGLKYEDLDKEGFDGEKEWLNQQLEMIGDRETSVESIKKYILSQRDLVETKLTEYNISKEQDLFLKARLRNYMFLLALIDSPDKAKESLERQINSLKSSKIGR